MTEEFQFVGADFFAPTTGTTNEEGGAPASDQGNGFDFDFGDWGMATAHNETSNDASNPTTTGTTDVSPGGDFNFQWDDATTTSDLMATDSFAQAEQQPVVPVAAVPTTQRNAADMPPPSPLPPKVATAPAVLPVAPVVHHVEPVVAKETLRPPPPFVPTSKPMPPKSSQPLGGSKSSSPPTRGVVPPGISPQYIRDLIAEADALLETVPNPAPPQGGKVSDATFRLAVASSTQKALHEQEVIANSAADLLMATVAALDRMGPNPRLASLLEGKGEYSPDVLAATPVAHLLDMLTPMLVERTARLKLVTPATIALS